jgi:hypothetical protein
MQVIRFSAPIVGQRVHGTIVMPNAKSQFQLKVETSSGAFDGPVLLTAIPDENAQKETFIIVDANTKSGFILPLPFGVLSSWQGIRLASTVTRDAFVSACGEPSGNFFFKPHDSS